MQHDRCIVRDSWHGHMRYLSQLRRREAGAASEEHSQRLLNDSSVALQVVNIRQSDGQDDNLMNADALMRLRLRRGGHWVRQQQR